MKIFILEDDPQRMKWFYKTFHQHTILWTDNVKDAKIILKENPDIPTLFLDHDLGGKQMVSTVNENTGSALARWIKEEDGLFFDQIFIHSLNPVGAFYMREALTDSAKEVRNIPFPLLQKNIIEDKL